MVEVAPVDTSTLLNADCAYSDEAAKQSAEGQRTEAMPPKGGVGGASSPFLQDAHTRIRLVIFHLVWKSGRRVFDSPTLARSGNPKSLEGLFAYPVSL
jgi:hypothetical protein